jgi:membrane protease YdiL (CAAX protease family)
VDGTGAADGSYDPPPRMSVSATARPTRHLPLPWFLVVVVAYVAIIQGVGLLVGVDTGDSDSQFPTTESIVRNALIPIGLSIAFGIAVATWLGWWGEILRDDRPVRPWVRRVPITMLVAAVVGINYPHLADQAVGLVLCLVLLGVFVGFGEELMFRGIGVVAFRRAGLTEGRVALWSSIVFGLVHVSNAIGHGPQAFAQAAFVSTTGYLFYLGRRAGGTILLPMLAHGLWDFSLISSLVGAEPAAYPGMIVVILAQVGLIVVLIRRRHRIELPTAAADPGSASAQGRL